MSVTRCPTHRTLMALVMLVLAAGSQGASARSQGATTGSQGSTAQSVQGCTASKRWVTHPNQNLLLADPTGPLCGFYQVAWQSFLYLTQPATGQHGALNFETFSSVDTLQNGVTTPLPGAISFLDKRTNLTRYFRARGKKSPSPFTSTQAVSNAVLYDQNSQVTYYEQFLNPIAYDFIEACRLNIKACVFPVIPLLGSVRFPAGSIEIKVAWRVLAKNTPNTTYYRLHGVPVVQGQPPVDLGLVGFHLVYATPSHPEMVWATFEHVDNAPSGPCPASGITKEKPPKGFSGWAFNDVTSTNCTKSGVNVATTQTPTQVLRNYRYGSQPGSTGTTVAKTNDDTIASLNGSMRTILAEKSSVWRYFFLVGAVWTAGGALPAVAPSPPSTAGNEVGSTFLADATMETFLQAPADPTLITPGTTTVNCFSCHNQSAQFTNASFGVSHAIGGNATAACRLSDLKTLPEACQKTQTAQPVAAHGSKP
jgi:xanthosine utilization system XapX-like protein